MEQKNLARQNFVKSDVGKNKAEVLATRYGRAYEINIVPIIKMVLADAQAQRSVIADIFGNLAAIRGNSKATIVISCVDTMSARQNILNAFSAVWSNGGIFIDGGNEDVYGQVMISNPNKILTRQRDKDFASDFPQITGMLPVKSTLNFIPLDLNFYARMGDQGSSRSCADLDQTMAINSLVANTMFGIIQNIMYSKPIAFARINVTLSGSTPELMTPLCLWNMAQQSENNGRKGSELAANIEKLQGLAGSVYEYQSFRLAIFGPLSDALELYNYEKRKAEEAIQKEARRLLNIERLAKLEADRAVAKFAEDEANRRAAEESARTALKERAAEKKVAAAAITIPPLTPIPPMPIPAGARETTPGISFSEVVEFLDGEDLDADYARAA
jgi:hypothetical protein